MTKEDFPTSPDELDGWLDACGEFTDKFKTLVQTIVYLYKIRDIVSTEQLASLCDAAISVLKQICAKECNEDVFGGQTCCSVGEYLNALVKNPKEDATLTATEGSSSTAIDVSSFFDFSKTPPFNLKHPCEECVYAMPVDKNIRPHFGWSDIGCTNAARINHLVEKAAFLLNKKNTRNLIDAKDILEMAIAMKICYGNYGGCECECVSVEKFTDNPPKPSCFIKKVE